MILTIAYHHKDACATVRLLRWMWFLSCQDNFSLEKEQILLVPSRGVALRSIHKHIQWLADQTFGKWFTKVPVGENELGWPAAPNYAFRTALEEVESKHHQDMLWLEADAVPIRPDWLRRIKEEWQEAQASGKNFLGAMVLHYVDHMSGVGVYGRNWRKIAPKLVQAPDHQAWDTWAADQVVPNLHVTKSIQHIFYNPIIKNLNILDDDAKIFHQDKRGNLIALLDREVYDGQVDADPLFNYSRIRQESYMRKCYHADNSNRRIKSQGFEFVFHNYDNFGGTWRGVYVTEDAAEIAALDSLTADPRNAIRDIPEAEYEEKAKKKLSPLSPSNDWSPQLAAPSASLKGTGAVVVDEGKSADPLAPSNAPLESIESAIVVEQVEPSQPAPDTLKKKITVVKPRRASSLSSA